MSKTMGPDYQMYDNNAPKKKIMDDALSDYSYAPKSRMLYNKKGLGSASAKRSLTNSKLYAKAGLRMKEQVGPHYGETASQKQDTKSQLSFIAMQRFNEKPEDDRPKSQARSIFSRPKSQAGSKIGSYAGHSVFSQQ